MVMFRSIIIKLIVTDKSMAILSSISYPTTATVSSSSLPFVSYYSLSIESSKMNSIFSESMITNSTVLSFISTTGSYETICSTVTAASGTITIF